MWGCDGEDPRSVQESFEAVVRDDEQARSSQATGQKAHNGWVTIWPGVAGCY
uniref:Uncharacterized protein n=1 Tax=Arundo donax TaxID=35708 RepID=A0A0A9D8G3_ARUDO